MKKNYETVELIVNQLDKKNIFLLTSTEKEKADNYISDDFNDYGLEE